MVKILIDFYSEILKLCLKRSYGVVIWELCTYADYPYTGMENEEVVKYVKSGGKLEVPPNSPAKL